jgi:UDP-2,3-diacylglucosamine hydrolase
MAEGQAVVYAAVVADGHLDGEPTALSQFLAFLRYLSTIQVQALYLLGDIFTLWLGVPRLQLSYHVPVLKALQSLADQGIAVIYVEGNRDYFLSPHYVGQPFTEIASEFSELSLDERRFYLAHGDLVNVHDTQYRRWRRFSRNRAVYTLFMSLPKFVAIRLAHALEKRFRETNQKHKTAFPATTCEHFAMSLFTRYDAVILGHFYYQYQYTERMNGRPKSLYVLPAWKDIPGYLEISWRGECKFKTFYEE